MLLSGEALLVLHYLMREETSSAPTLLDIVSLLLTVGLIWQTHLLSVYGHGHIVVIEAGPKVVWAGANNSNCSTNAAIMGNPCRKELLRHLLLRSDDMSCCYCLLRARMSQHEVRGYDMSRWMPLIG